MSPALLLVENFFVKLVLFFLLMGYNLSMNYVDVVVQSFWQFQASFVAVIVPLLVVRFVFGYISNRFKA